MSSSSGARFLLLVVPLLFFGCFVAGEDKNNDEDEDEPSGCRNDADCRAGRVCIDVSGDFDGLCEGSEDCSCGPPGSGGAGGNATGGVGGNATGGSTMGDCRSDLDCREGRVCVDLDGDRDGFCESSEECGCASLGTGGTGNSNGGSGTSGNANGGATTGGSATGGSSTGGASGGSDCGVYCDRIAAAMCATTDTPACLSACASFSADCPMEAPPMLACIADPTNTVSCMSGSTVIQGCDAELEAMDRCFICVPETADMECMSCSKENCCEALGDYNVAPDVQGFFDCVNACTTSACFDGCVTSFPIAGAAALAMVDCQNTSCAEPCICEVTTNDDACATCYKGSCCTEYVAYSLASDLEGFETCAVECLDDLCIDDCANSFPVAGNAFWTWSDCAAESCSVQCQ
jgi:hypothetical protein